MRIFGYSLDVVEAIILANVLVFFIVYASPESLADSLFKDLSLRPDSVLSRPWTILTSMFIHADLTHLLFNMITLYFFGQYLERLAGERQTLTIYFAGGIFAGLAYIFTSFAFNLPPPYVSAVGASGAVFALTGTLVVLRPKTMIFVYFVPMPLYLYALLYTGWALYAMAATMGGQIAHNAHLGGLIAGLYFGVRMRRSSGAIVSHDYPPYGGY